MMETIEERSFIREALQNFKEDYSSLMDPTYCNINVGSGSLKLGVNNIQDNHSIRMECHDDLCSERINGVIKKFIQMVSMPSIVGRRSVSRLNIIIGINILNDNNHYLGRVYEIELQKDGSLTLIDVVRKNN